MSNTYNSQLQSNNTDLQTVLQTLQNKVVGGEQATPEISINSSTGLITATAGTKSSTYQLTTQAAKTITPSTSSQTAVASGRYTTGAVTVAGDSNLVAENIVSGVSIFGVEGSASGGSVSIQTATVTISNTAPLPSYPVYYIGTSGAINATHSNAPFTCVIPSIMALKDGGRSITTSGNISLLLKYGNVSAYLINGDGAINMTSSGSGADD